MARLRRLFAPGVPMLALQRTKPGEALIRNDGDAELLTRTLFAAAQAAALELHAFVILPEELRILASASQAQALSATLQQVGRTYVANYNRRYSRSGTLWAGRFRSTVLEAESWLVDAMLAIEQAPVQAGLAAEAAHYPWSSHRQHVGLSGELALTDHREYWRLGNTPFERQRVYQARAAAHTPGAREALLWSNLEGGWALGSSDFMVHIGQVGARRPESLQRGRPRRK